MKSKKCGQLSQCLSSELLTSSSQRGFKNSLQPGIPAVRALASLLWLCCGETPAGRGDKTQLLLPYSVGLRKS